MADPMKIRWKDVSNSMLSEYKTLSKVQIGSHRHSQQILIGINIDAEDLLQFYIE